MKKSKVLILAVGWEQIPLIKRLLEIEDIELYAVNYSKDHEDLPFIDILYADIRDLELVLAYAKKVQPDVVLSDQDDYAHFCQALIATELNLPGPSIKQAQISSNKYLQRLRCSETGIKYPDFQMVYTTEQVVQFADQYGYPVILKPIDNRGSFGVNKIDSASEVDAAFYDSILFSHSRLLVVERFIVGQEVTVDGYCINGKVRSLGIATKQKLNEKLQVSFDIKYPGTLVDSLKEKVLRNNEEVVEKLGYNFGMTHGEYIINSQEDIYLIEVANRGGGCFTSEIIVPTHSGIDLVSKYINDCFGSQVLEERSFGKKEVLLKFLNFQPGKVKKIHGLELLDENPNVLKYRILVKAGDDISPVSSDANRHGFVIVSSNSEVERECENIIELINIEYYE